MKVILIVGVVVEIMADAVVAEIAGIAVEVVASFEPSPKSFG